MENGKIAIVPEIRPPLGYGSTEFFVMRSRTDGIGRWIAYWVARSSFRQLARESMQGAVGQRRVPRVWLENASVPLAPLSEQHRIVARIESLFARLDEGLAALKRAQANLERYRASVLKAAVEGNLTERWRRENPPCETGEDLLQRILAERRRRWETEQLAKFEAKEGSRQRTGGTGTRSWRNRTSLGCRNCRKGGAGRQLDRSLTCTLAPPQSDPTEPTGVVTSAGLAAVKLRSMMFGRRGNG